MLFKVLLLNLVLFFSVFSYADRYFLNPVGGSSAEADLKQSVFELLSSGLLEQNQQIATDKNAAEFSVDTQLLKLGSAYLITVQKSAAGKVVFSQKMKAASAEEIDKATNRLARSLVSQGDVNQESRIGEITTDETTKLKKRTETLDFRVYSFGLASFDKLKASEKNIPSIYLNTGYQYDVTEQSAIRLMGEVAWRQDPAWATFWNFGIGYGYYLRNAPTSPFVAVDFGYGGAQCQGLESELGMTLAAQVGLGMFRTSQKQMNLSLRAVHLFRDNGEGAPTLLAFVVSALL